MIEEIRVILEKLTIIYTERGMWIGKSDPITGHWLKRIKINLTQIIFRNPRKEILRGETSDIYFIKNS